MPHTKVLRPRPISITTYFLLGVAGVSFLFWEPSPAIKELMGAVKFVVWNIFFMVGGLIGMYGAAKRIYRLELVALPLVGTAIMAYGVAAIPRLGQSPAAGTLFGVTLIFLAAVSELVGRGWELGRVIRISNKLRRRQHE